MRLSARLRVIASLVPRDRGLIVDVGADHGYVAAAVGGIAVERMPHRRGAAAVPWVIADGLRPFRSVGVAVIAGMGADRIAGILRSGPRPAVAVLHADDDPWRLRAALAADGWRIADEAVVEERGRFHEIEVVEPGTETATGDALRLGPHLLAGTTPAHRAWRTHGIAVREAILARITDPSRRTAIAREIRVMKAGG